ncbi:MAG: glycosyltransferase family 4 protein, partial [Zoogloeaceae bacterium]|nr:glycosyltransferase family 4 protein [Zoogloeaceae bacterium]
PESEKTADARAHGLVWHALPLTRSGTNPFTEMAALWALIRLFRRIRPAIVHLVTVKPVIYGGIAARLTRVPAVVAAVSGLGFVFSHRGFKASMIRFLVGRLYRMALGHPGLRVIFQNPDDAQCIARLAALPVERTCLIRGAGVDLAEYILTPLPEDECPLIILPARLLKSKGVLEFVEAARQLLASGVKARFALVGVPDAGNPDSVTDAAIAAWIKEGSIEYWGYRDDMPIVLSRSSLVVLPSFYAEGLPKALIEAQACGRAVVTSDWPGCRDAIAANVTGLLVPPRDAAALAKAIGALLDDRERLRAMGKAARALAEEAFDVRQVVRKHLEIYRSLIP